MKISFWSIGKPHEAYVKPGIDDFTKRLSNYFSVQWNIIPVPKNAGMLSEPDLKKKEAETILNFLKPEDYLVALDEKGREFSSEGLAKFIQQRANESTRHIVFLIGGAFGLDEKNFKGRETEMVAVAADFPSSTRSVNISRTSLPGLHYFAK